MAGYAPGFESLDEERSEYQPPVEGDLPEWLSGTLYRNGPAKFEAGGDTADHWFDGLAMLQRYDFGDALTYSNRFLRSEAYAEAHESGFRGSFSASGGYLRRLWSMLRGEVTDNANVHVARFAGELVALTETPRGVVFNPDLETRGDFTFDDDLSLQQVTAHYARDQERGEYVGYGTSFGRTNEYVLYRVPDGSRSREPIARYPVDSPAYLHDLGLTPNYAVLAEPPFVVDPIDFLLPGGGGFVDHFEWRPDRGSRFLVFDRESGDLVFDRESGDLVLEREVDPFFVFHHVNAFEAGGDLVVDLVAYPDAAIVSDLSLEALAGGAPDVADGELRRYRLSLDGDDVATRTVYTGMELPRVSPDVRGREYRYAYGQATHREGQNGLVKVDLETGEATEWWNGVYAEEPIFVPAPGNEEGAPDGEDEGVVLATALDADAGHSELLVLDGESFEVRARARLPHAIPFGFHGRYFPGRRTR